MNSLIHMPTCQVWQSAATGDCDCFATGTPWRIRKEPDEPFPWRIWRRTNDEVYEPLMRCSTFIGACQLVEQLIWLRAHAVQRDTNV